MVTAGPTVQTRVTGAFIDICFAPTPKKKERKDKKINFIKCSRSRRRRRRRRRRRMWEDGVRIGT